MQAPRKKMVPIVGVVAAVLALCAILRSEATRTPVPLVRGPHRFGDARAVQIEDLDRPELELIEVKPR